MNALGTLLDWIAAHEDLFSGLVALVALVGIAAAGVQLLWVRASRLGAGVAASRRRRALGVAATGTATAALLLVLATLERPGSAGAAGRSGPPTIAVLPFTPMSGSEDYDWICDGLTEDIITLLASSPAIRVIARNSTFQYKGRAVDVRKVATDLGADFVVEGSVRPLGASVRVTVQLIEAATGNHVWADKYDRPLSDLFALEDEVTMGIAAAVGDEVFNAEAIRATQAKSDNLDAWSLAWRAYANWSVEDAREAVRLDPGYGFAVATLGFNLALKNHYGPGEPATFDEAVETARQGARLAPDDILVLSSLGATLMLAGQPVAALAVLEPIPSRSPSYAPAFAWLGDALIHNGRPQDALAELEHAIALTPNSRLSWLYEFMRAEALIHLGRYEAARAVLDQARLRPDHPVQFATIASLEALAGNQAEARRLMERARAINPEFNARRYREVYKRISTDAGGPHFKPLFDALEAAVE